MNKWSVSPEELMRQEPRGGVVYKKYHALPFLPVYPIGESDSFENLVERNDTTHEIVCETLRWILDGGETSQNKVSGMKHTHVSPCECFRLLGKETQEENK